MAREVLGIVTARGGSKRISKKSNALLDGKPLMGYVVAAMKRAKMLTRIIVDTDDPEMADVGRRFGAEIPYMRPKELAQDGTGHVPVLKNALDSLKAQNGYWPDAVCLIQPTSPLVQPSHIDDALALLFESGVDSVETVFEVPTIFHPYNVRYIDDDRFTKFVMPKERREAAKTGKRPKMYAIGTVITFLPKNLWDYGTIQGKTSKSVIIDKKYAVDVDEPYDLLVAETLRKNL